MFSLYTSLKSRLYGVKVNPKPSRAGFKICSFSKSWLGISPFPHALAKDLERSLMVGSALLDRMVEVTVGSIVGPFLVHIQNRIR